MAANGQRLGVSAGTPWSVSPLMYWRRLEFLQTRLWSPACIAPNRCYGQWSGFRSLLIGVDLSVGLGVSAGLKGLWLSALPASPLVHSGKNSQSLHRQVRPAELGIPVAQIVISCTCQELPLESLSSGVAMTLAINSTVPLRRWTLVAQMVPVTNPMMQKTLAAIKVSRPGW